MAPFFGSLLDRGQAQDRLPCQGLPKTPLASPRTAAVQQTWISELCPTCQTREICGFTSTTTRRSERSRVFLSKLIYY